MHVAGVRHHKGPSAPDCVKGGSKNAGGTLSRLAIQTGLGCKASTLNVNIYTLLASSPLIRFHSSTRHFFGQGSGPAAG